MTKRESKYLRKHKALGYTTSYVCDDIILGGITDTSTYQMNICFWNPVLQRYECNVVKDYNADINGE